ncbi:MAG TPA: LytTR family DNA-binding domain-containing protein [Vicinamibacterales bacterium]|nr:LytTR family DNA-binding domain-containing protein [Vicinamibacterales bacterium]
MTLRAVVVDDEQLAREELCFLLARAGGIEIVGQAANGVDGLRLVGAQQPDLLLLDVQMPGLNGFEVAHRLLDAARLPHLVFVTAYDQYALDAFKVHAVDYLLKPVDAERLDETLARVRQRVDADHRAKAAIGREELERVLRAVSEAPKGAPRHDQFAIRTGERFLLVSADEIVHASMVDDAIVVVTNTASGTSNYRTLDELSARLDPSVFWRVHRSHLVNITKIKEIVPWFSRNYILKMKDPKATEIPVSRAQTRRLRDYLRL